MKITQTFLLILLIAGGVMAQESRVHWKRTEPLAQKTGIFHSAQAVNLPTTTTLKKGEFEYEISHRFLPVVNTEKAYFGIDGPAHIRTALGYGISDRLIVVLGRSNFEDNYDLQFKYRLLEDVLGMAPYAVALRAGAAWSTEINQALAGNRSTTDSKNFQYYAQAIVNTLLWKRLGIGLVPSYVYNSHIYCKDTKYSFTVGSYVQFYLGKMISLFVENNTTISGYRGKYNSLHAGVELETGGHFFKIFVGNNSAENPSQYLAGSDLDIKFKGDNLRLGFVITRILKL